MTVSGGKSVVGVCCLLLCLALAGCGAGKSGGNTTAARTTPSGEVIQDRLGRYKVGNSYEIAGIVYQPREKYQHTETGHASWYGPGFHGRLTANGERYDQGAMTAAHRTLQMPSIIRVTNMANGRSVILRVNDRGPYHDDRVLDVSAAAAEALDFKHLGITKVRIDVLGAASREVAALARKGSTVASLDAVRLRAATRTPPAAQRAPQPTPSVVSRDVQVASAVPGGPGGVVGSDETFIQAGAFGEIANARSLQRKLEGLGAVKIEPTFSNGRRLYRVRLGPYPEFETAEGVLREVVAMGLQNAKLVVIR